MKTFSVPGGVAGPPSACSAMPDRLDVFAVRPGGIVSRWSWDGTVWTPSDLPNLGGVIPAEGVCAVSSGPGLVEVFAVERTARRAVWWRGDLTTPPGSWRNGGPLPGGANIPEVPVAAVCASPDYIDVFAVDGNTPRWWHWEGSWWNDMGPLPGGNLPAVQIAAVSPAPGRLDVFAVGRDTHLWHWWRIGATAWSREDLGGNLPAVGVSAVSWGANRIDVFAASRAPGFPLQHWAWDGTIWSRDEIGSNFAPGAVSAVSHDPNRLDVFGITRDQQLAYWQWDGRRWSGPSLRGQNIPAGDVSAVVRVTHRLDAFVMGSGNTLRQWPGGGLENVTNQGWENWPTNHKKLPPPGTLRPDSLEELVNIVSEAGRLKQGVRAVGTSWSTSDVAMSSGYVVDTSLLGAVLTDVLSTSLNASLDLTGSSANLFHVEAGIKLNVLVQLLHDRGLALKTLGGDTGQSLAGAVSTCVHGMDKDRGPLPDMVRAIHLVGPGGVQHWIEPHGRIITDRNALRSALGLPDENIHYDDDWFYSVLVSMGNLGIIYSLVIAVDQQYDLVENRELLTWTDMRARLALNGAANPLFGAQFRGVQVVIDPYLTGPGGSRKCYLTTRTQDVASDVAPPDPDLSWLVEGLAPALLLTWMADRSTVDDFISDATEKNQKQRSGYKGYSHTLSGRGDPGEILGLGLEVIFDANSTGYLDFVDAALEIIRAAYYDGRPRALSYLGWISLRFQGRSVAYLSPQHRSDLNCTIEFAAAWRVPGRAFGTPEVIWPDTKELLSMIESEGRRRGGIQHWGMNQLIDASDVERAYPRLDTWRRVRWELTKSGTITTFDSEFTRRCGLSAPPNTSLPLPGLGKDIGVGADGSVWVIGTNPVGAGADFGVHKWNGTSWDGVDGGGVRIAVGPDGTPWVVNSAGQIFHRQGASWGRPLPGLGKDIGVGADGSVWVIGTNPVGAGADFGIYKWNGTNWDGMGGGGVRIAVGPDGTPWVVNSVGQIFRRQGTSWGAPLPGLGKDIGVGADGSGWVIGTNPVGAGADFGVHKWNGANWDGLANSGGVGIAGDPSGRAWLVNSVGQIFRRS
jgi:hypothetical protein